MTAKTFSVVVVALALSLAFASSAQATAVQLTSPASLSAGDTTLDFSGTLGATISSPVSYTAGSNALTFSDAGGTFEVVQVSTTNCGTTGYCFTAFPLGTNLLYAAGYYGSDAPITITFASPVTEVGFNAEEFANGPYTMSFTAYNGATNLGTFTSSGCDPDPGPCTPSSGVLSFEGVQTSGGDVITSITISDGNGNDIGLGPVTFGTTVPEPSSLLMLSFALGGCGLMRRRKSA